jgi:hypothetical protein
VEPRALGNWQSLTTDGVAESRQHDAQNALTQVGGTPLAYSPNGEMTADHRGQTITYDPWGRVRFVTPQSDPGVGA